MGRPSKRRRIRFHPRVVYFKPRGVPLRKLSEVEIKGEEIEAIRLKYGENLEQVECAREMKTSQSTFGRILGRANRKIALALIKGKALRISKN